MDRQINIVHLIKIIFFFFLITAVSCNKKEKKLICNNIQLSKQDSIQIITKLINSPDFLAELPNCDEETPFIMANNGYITNSYNLKYKKHPLILKSLVDILYINGQYEDTPIKENPIYRIGPRILIEISDFKFQKDSVFIQMILCGNGTFFNFSFKKNSDNNWEANLLQKGNT
tara:strand:- start:1204 stop:1722 length:519 start_codon:yes stop_codon:yes gene_type:complete